METVYSESKQNQKKLSIRQKYPRRKIIAIQLLFTLLTIILVEAVFINESAARCRSPWDCPAPESELKPMPPQPRTPESGSSGSVARISPYINRYWVDACVVRNGRVDCSRAAGTQAANALCRDKGHSSADEWESEDSGPGHETYRWTDGQWEFCDRCGIHFTRVVCNK